MRLPPTLRDLPAAGSIRTEVRQAFAFSLKTISQKSNLLEIVFATTYFEKSARRGR
jgi:hypothetical protein